MILIKVTMTTGEKGCNAYHIKLFYFTIHNIQTWLKHQMKKLILRHELTHIVCHGKLLKALQLYAIEEWRA